MALILCCFVGAQGRVFEGGIEQLPLNVFQ